MEKRFGIIVATEPEQAPFIEIFGKPTYVHNSDNYTVLMWNKIHEHTICLIRSGYGEIAAAAATQFLIDKFHVDEVINYGVVGGLRDDLVFNKVGVVSKIVHYGFDVSGGGKYPVGRYPNQDDVFIRPQNNIFSYWATQQALGKDLPDFVCASADKFVMGGPPKRQLRKEFEADICEMEAAGIVLTCKKNNVPCNFIKAISDGVDEDEEAFDRNVHNAAKICVEIIFKTIQII